MENDTIVTAKMPWAGHTGEIPLFLQYFEGSMFDKVAEIAERYPNNVAFDFMGKSTTYREMIAEIEKCAKALKTIGVRENDKVTIAMPNCPQAMPYDIEFREDLPKTLVGKVAYRVLEEEELKKLSEEKKNK